MLCNRCLLKYLNTQNNFDYLVKDLLSLLPCVVLHFYLKGNKLIDDFIQKCSKEKQLNETDSK